MEIDENAPERDAALSSSPLSDADSSSGSDSDEQPKIEWLATGRERRSTAGNRMKSMLANEEEPDSDLELLFAEQGDDQGFSDVDAAASDDQMDSSSDEEDNNNNNDAEDLEGEKELERQAKERRAAQRKRKAQEAIPVKFRKRVRIDTASVSSSATARPKKKSERASWLPAVADMPTRASSRKTTRISKEQLHQQMEEREARRLKQLAQMEKKQAKLEAMKKPPMTQEDRLREAAIVEERNSKSLNRWEEAEKQREEERLAKLAALNNRTLKGPVITFWSGVGRVGDGWLKNEGYHFMIEEKPKRKPKPPKGKDKDNEKGKEDDATKTTEAGDAPKEAVNPDDKSVIVVKQEDAVAKGTPAPPTEDQTPKPNIEVDQPEVATNEDAMVVDEPVPKDVTENTVEGAEKTTVAETDKPTDMNIDDNSAAAEPTPTSEAEKPNKVDDQPEKPTSPQNAAEAESKSIEESTPTAAKEIEPESTVPDAKPESKTDTSADEPLPKPSTEASSDAPVESKDVTTTESQDVAMADAAPATLTETTTPVAPQPPVSSTETPKEDQAAGTPQATDPAQSMGPESVPVSKPTSQLPSEAVTPVATAPEDTSTGEATTRNAIMFQNFHEPAIRDKPTQTMLLFGRKMSKLPKQPPPAICGVTNTLARYRDPVTKIPFATAAAYGELQRLQSSQYQWSKLLGCWVGSGTVAAKGVPERFLRTARCPTLEEVERIQAKKEQRIAAEKAEKEKAKELEKAEKEKKKAAAKEKKKGDAASAAAKTEGTADDPTAAAAAAAPAPAPAEVTAQ